MPHFAPFCIRHFNQPRKQNRSNMLTKTKPPRLSKKQKQVINFANDDGALLLSCGPVRSGKSFACMIGFLLYTQSLDESFEHLILGKNKEALKSAIVQPMMQYGRALGAEAYFRDHKSWLKIGRQEYHVRAGAEGSNAARQIQGLTCHSSLLDEAALFPPDFFNMGLSRCSHENSKIWCSTNCEGPSNFLKKDWIDRGKFDVLFDGESAFSFSDNPSLDARTRARLESSFHGIFHDRKIKSLWAAASGVIFEHFRIVQSIGVQIKSTALSVDVGNGTISAILAMQNLQNEKHHLADEIQLKKASDDEIVEAVRAMAIKHNAERVIVDPSAVSTIQALRADKEKGNWRIRKAKNAVLPGIRHLGAALQSQKLTISPKCEKLTRELGGYVWGENEKPKKENDHSIDCARYLSMSEIKRTINHGPVALPAGL